MREKVAFGREHLLRETSVSDKRTPPHELLANETRLFEKID